MLSAIVGAGLRYRFMILAAAIALFAFSAMRAWQMPVDTFPEFAPPVVEIQTEAPGLAASEVERLVTLPIEELMSGVSWLKTLQSETVAGLSSVRLLFEPGTDLMRARQLVQERLTLSYTIPTSAKAPVMLQPLSATNRVMMVGLSSKDLPLIQQSVIAQWIIKPKLLGVPGVANVSIWGERRRQLQVHVDTDKLREAGVKQEQIVTSAGDSLYVASLSYLKASNPGSGGWIDGPNQRLEIRHVLPIASAEDLGKVSVDGTKKRLSELTKVVEGHPPMVGEGIVDGKPGLIIVVEKLPGASTVDVSRRVKVALAAMRTGLPGLTLDDQLFNAANYIEEALENNALALGFALVLMAIVLALMLYSARAAVVAVASIALSICAVLVVLNLTGTTLNTVVFAGILLALSAIVDEVATVVHGILRRNREAPTSAVTREQLARTISELVVALRRTVGYVTVGLLLLALPIYFMGGLLGSLLKPLALSYMLAIAAGVLTALVVTPALATLLLAGHAGTEAPSLVRRVSAGYARLVREIVARPAGTYLAAGVLIAGALAMWPLLNRALLPDFQDRDLTVRWNAAAGASHPGMTRITTNAVKELKAIPGVRAVSAHFGRAITGDQVVAMNSGQIWISIDQAADYDRTVAAIRATLAEYPGMDREVQSFLRERVREALTGVSQPVVVRIFGPDREILAQKAEEIRQLLSRVNGLVDLRVSGQVTEPQLHVKADIVAAAQHGLKPGDVRRAAATLFSGLEVGKIFEQQKVFDVVVWSGEETRANPTGLANMLVETPGGNHVRLGQLADLSVKATPTVIRHERASPYMDVTAGIQGRDVVSTINEVQRRIADVRFPLEHHPEVLGEYSEQRSAKTRALAVAIGAGIGIVLLLQALTGSWSLSLICSGLVIASLAGGVIAAMIFGGDVSIGSLVAFIGIVTIALRQVFLVLQRLQDRRASGESLGPELAIATAEDRLMPTLTTALAIAAALLPFIVLGNVAGLEIERPMAIVLLGGLIMSTTLTLLVMPPLLLRFANSMTTDGIKGLQK